MGKKVKILVKKKGPGVVQASQKSEKREVEGKAATVSVSHG